MPTSPLRRLSRSPLRTLTLSPCHLVTLSFVLLTATLRAQTTAGSGSLGGQSWQYETLANGLRVIYAPMPSSPTTHVRVIYHVGSRDERSDRQGFAHMFEHMMFRGSAHVAPQQHMKLIGLVGGYSNASTSFDQTMYVNTVPASYTELALWLEADRMSSFKVSPEIFVTERKVVSEEWRLHINQPYGTVWDELFSRVFTVHPYHWMPIGNMQHLQAARAGELQDFFNKYYVPNNAILSIAGNIDVAKTREQVHKYFGWIPGRGPTAYGSTLLPSGTMQHTPTFFLPLSRDIPAELPQTEPRRATVTMRVPFTRVLLAWHSPPAKSDDNDALGLLLSILGDGRSSRLARALVTSDQPLCSSVDAPLEALEDGGIMGAMATLLDGKDPAAVEKVLRDQIADLRDDPVTAEELEKVKQELRLTLATRFETADKVAGDLGGDWLTYGNLDHIQTDRQRLEALTPADLQRVARKYLPDNGVTTLLIMPGEPAPTTAPATSPGTESLGTSSEPTTLPDHTVSFPPDYPTTPPMTGALPAAVFDKGVESPLGPQPNAPRLIVMPDHRMPMVNWSITIRSGGFAEPEGKEGLAGLTAAMVRRGPRGKTYDQFNEELEARGISLEVADGRDNTLIAGSCLKDDLPQALAATRDILVGPAFDQTEFAKLKTQALAGLKQELSSPTSVASRTLTAALWGDSPLGRLTSLASLKSITLDDIRKFYADIYRAPGAILMISGDISVEDAQKASPDYFGAWAAGRDAPPAVNYRIPAPGEMASVVFKLPPTYDQRRIILVDRPGAQQSNIRMGIRAFDITSNEKFPGTLTGQILSNGIESRLGEYVRAQKGYVYGVTGLFSPSRQAGAFLGATDTRPPTTADTIEAMFKVFNDMRTAEVTPQELADAKSRVAGGLLMSMETTRTQANQRVTGILNNYPIDYYDKYAQRIGQVTADDIKSLMNKYVLDDRMVIVVVGPASTVKPQLDRLGPVEVVPMPPTD